MKIRLLGIYGLIFIIFGGVAAIFFHQTFLAPAAYVEIIVGFVLLLIYLFHFFGETSKNIWRKRDVFFGVLGGGLLLALLVGMNVIAHSKWGDQKWDLTTNKIHSLSPESIETLRRLPVRIDVLSFVVDPRAKSLFKNLIDKYSFQSNNIRFQQIDPDRDPQQLEMLGAQANQVVLVNSESGKTIHLGPEQFSEQELTTALRRLLVEKLKKIYFLSGRGEGDINDDKTARGLYIAKMLLEREGYQVSQIDLSQGIPNDAAVIAAWGAQSPISDFEIQILEKYLENSGKLVIAQDPLLSAARDRIIPSGWAPLLHRYGLRLGDEVLIQNLQFQSQNIPSATILGLSYTDQEIVKDLRGNLTQFPMAQPVESFGKEPVGEQKALVLTAETVAAVKDLKALTEKRTLKDTGPYALGRIVNVPKKLEIETPEIDSPDSEDSWKSQLVVFGDSDFGSNQHIQSALNRDLFLNIFAYLLGESDSILIRPKSWRTSTLEMTDGQKRGVYFASIFLMPQFIILLGMAIWAIRRSRKAKEV
jgi:ABC-type uncharacterized transport system involved in gliding motility auxiliary subunit